MGAPGPLRRRDVHRRSDRHRHDAGRVRAGRHGVRPQVRRCRLRAVRPHLREEPRPLDAQSLGRLLETLHARGDHGRHDDRLSEHPPDVFGQLRRCRRRRGRQRREAQDVVARAAASRGEGVRFGPDVGPVPGGVPGAARRQHADEGGCGDRVRAGRGRPRRPRPRRAARLLRHRRTRPLRQPRPVRGGRCGRLLQLRRTVARRQASRERVRRPPVQGPPDLGNGHRQHLGDLPPPPWRGRRSPDRGSRRSASRTSSASARPAASTSWRSPRPDRSVAGPSSGQPSGGTTTTGRSQWCTTWWLVLPSASSSPTPREPTTTRDASRSVD